jgi:amino acid permease
MIDTIISFVTNVELNSLMGFYLYWAPTLYCLVFYFVRTVVNYRVDKEQHEKYLKDPRTNYYSPSENVGGIVGRIVVSFLPVVNIWCALFDLTPDVVTRFTKYIGNLLDIPLVPKKKVDKD